MATTQESTSEAAIFGRILEPELPSFEPAAAQAILALEFHPRDKERMRALVAKAKDGALSVEEKTEIDNYERVGHLLSLMKSKARRSLKRAETHESAPTP